MTIAAATTEDEAFRAGPFEICPRLLTLSGPGGTVSLQPRVMAVLVALLARRGAVVSRDELIAEVWNGRVVSDDALNRCIGELRRAFGQPGDVDPILTVPRVGYRFTLPVTPLNVTAPSRAEPTDRSTPDISHSPPAVAVRAPTAIAGFRRRYVVAAGFIVVGVAILLGWWVHGERETSLRGTAGTTGGAANLVTGVSAAPGTVAVMRFANLTADNDQGYLVDGVAEEILDRLAAMPNLKVIASNSSFVVDPQKSEIGDLRSIAKQLSVRYLIVGAVRRERHELRISIRLIDGVAGQLVWAHSFVGEIDEVFKLQSDIGRQVAERLEPAGSLSIIDVTQPQPATEAYEAYLRGRYAFQRRHDAAGIAEAIRDFQAAVNADSSFAMAHALLAAALAVSPTYSERVDKIASIERGEKEARVAIQLDPRSAMAYAVLGYCELGTDPLLAERDFQHALRLSPNLVEAHHWYHQLLLDVGRIQAALEEGQLAIALDPVSAPLLASMAEAHYLQGDLKQAKVFANRSQQVGVADINQVLSKIAFAEGNLEESARLWAADDADNLSVARVATAALANPQELPVARIAVEKEMAKLEWPQRGWSELNMRVYLGDLDGGLAALDELERRVGSRALQYFFSADLWDPESQIRAHYDDPKFQILLRRSRLLGYFRESGTTPDACRWNGEKLDCTSINWLREVDSNRRPAD